MAWARCMLGEGLVIGSGLCPQLGRVHYSELQYCYLHMSHWVGQSSHPLSVWSSDFSLEPVFRVSYYYYYFFLCVNFIKSLLHPFPGVRVSWDCFFFSSGKTSEFCIKTPLAFPVFSPSIGSTWAFVSGHPSKVAKAGCSTTLLAQLERLLVIWFMAITSTFKCPKHGEPQTWFKC